MRNVKLMMIVLLVMTVVLAACSKSNDKQEASPDGNGSSDRPVELSLFVRSSADIAGYDNNEMTRKIEQKLNIKFDFEVAPAEGVYDKQQILFASGDYPAAFLAGEFTQNDQINLGTSGMLIPLNDLIERYAPNIKQAFATRPYYEHGVTSPDGNIYALPAFEECYHCQFPNKVWINKAWLDQLGLGIPRTTQEFEQALLAFKNDDPNGNGKADEIPLSGGGAEGQVMAPVGYFLNAFIYDNEIDYLYVENGKVGFAPSQPQWLEGLRYLNSLYRQGLLDPNAFTQNVDGLRRLGDNEEAVILGAFSAAVSAQGVSLDGDRWTDYVALPPLEGPQGVRTAAYRNGEVFTGTFAITNKATEQQQVAAIRLADWLFSVEGTLDNFFGVKGKGWFEPAAGDVGIDGNPALYAGSEGEDGVLRDYAWPGMLYFMTSEMFNGWASSVDTSTPEGYEAFLYQATLLYDGTQPQEIYPLTVWMSAEDAQNVAQLQLDLTNYVKQKQIRFITGLDDLDTGWDAYIEGFKKYKLDEFLRYKQNALDAAK